jgi:hypothetical protein
MSRFGMLSTFLKHFLLGFSPRFEITIDAYFTTTDVFGHTASCRKIIPQICGSIRGRGPSLSAALERRRIKQTWRTIYRAAAGL